MRHLACLSVAVIVAAVLIANSGVRAVAPSYLVDKNTSCYVSGKTPNVPMPLEFCHWYNENSCCNPGADAQALDAFFGAVNLGSGCAPMNQRVRAWYREVREMLCMPCDPKEPTYRVRQKDGDLHLGGIIVPDAGAADDAFVWRVCSSFVYGTDSVNLNGGMWGGDGSKFDKCGIQISNDCNSRTQQYYNPVTKALESTNVSTVPDGFSCGTTFVVPSVEFFDETITPVADAKKDAGRVFMEKLPHWIAGAKFQIVDDLDAAFSFEKTPCFGRRAADGIVLTGAAPAASPVGAAIVMAAMIAFLMISNSELGGCVAAAMQHFETPSCGEVYSTNLSIITM